MCIYVCICVCMGVYTDVYKDVYVYGDDMMLLKTHQRRGQGQNKKMLKSSRGQGCYLQALIPATGGLFRVMTEACNRPSCSVHLVPG